LKNRSVVQPGGPGTGFFDKKTGISLYFDLEHAPPKGPHADVTFRHAKDLGKWTWEEDGAFKPPKNYRGFRMDSSQGK
jgi:hypothetical protein